MSVPNLTREDAEQRASLLRIASYDVVLDLTDDSGKPSERTFRSTSTVRFRATRPGETTFVDAFAESIQRVTLNGRDLDIGEFDRVQGIRLPDLAADNELVVAATMLYTNTGEGMHRFVDPVDGQVYTYSQFETADAKRVYACFDQPDLKASFTFHVTVPDDWQVTSNAALDRVEERTVGKTAHFAPTPVMSPYVTAVVSGPYHGVRDYHDGIDLGIWCRQSLAPYLDPDEIFTVTKQGFDWYHANFGYRYAFGKYDQLFVPEFNAGAMENAGCVTIREDYVFRSKVTDARRERRAETILHEMAHMWFGDLVTMRWWDDLWLNESFATYAAVLAQTSATRWTNAWTTFANVEKTWGYRQDQLPSTHPIATDAPDVQTAEVNFDGITYAKGASVLKQLGAYVGVDAFLSGLRAYFAEHAFGNTTLADLLAALELSSGRPLGEWSKLWLETAGINTIRPEFALDAAGRFTSFEIVQSAPSEIALSNVLRPHRLAVGLYEDQADGSLVRVAQVETDVNGERTAVPELVGIRAPDLLLANDDDLTYCKLRLDARSLRTLRDGGIARLRDSLPRTIAWSAAWDMTRDGELATRDYLALVLSGAEAESDIGVRQSLFRQVLRALDIYADPEWSATGFRLLADAALAALRTAEPGSDYQLAWAHAFIGAARDAEHVEVMHGLLAGSEVVPGLGLDHELRWQILHTLSALGVAGEDQVAAELDNDPSALGHRHALTCRSLRPDATSKQEAWRLAFEDASLPNHMLEAVVAGFAHPTQGALLAPYAKRYFADVEGVWNVRTSEIAQIVVLGMFPTWTSTITPETLALADQLLARADLAPSLRRLVSEGRADIVRSLRARATDLAAAR